jgi:hypothetical protein
MIACSCGISGKVISKGSFGVQLYNFKVDASTCAVAACVTGAVRCVSCGTTHQ